MNFLSGILYSGGDRTSLISSVNITTFSGIAHQCQGDDPRVCGEGIDPGDELYHNLNNAFSGIKRDQACDLLDPA